MNSKIESKARLVVPPALVSVLDHLVTDYALASKEEPAACRRAVEELVIRLGLEAYRAELEAKFGDRMGWPTGNEEETT